MKKINLILLSEIIIISLVLGVFPVSVKADTGGYPYWNNQPQDCGSSDPGCVDPWNFFKRQCVFFVSWKLNQVYPGLNFINTMKGSNGNTATFGYAKNWDYAGSTIGFSTGNSPQVGAIAVFYAYVGGAGDKGHVAYVDNITNGVVHVQEYNWNWGDGNYNQRTLDSSHQPSSYIYFNNLCGGTNITIQGQSLNNINCSASNSIKILPETKITGESKLYIQ